MQGETIYYRVIPGNDQVRFEKAYENELYDNHEAGFVRKAIVNYDEQSSLIVKGKFKDR